MLAKGLGPALVASIDVVDRQAWPHANGYLALKTVP